MREFFLKSFLWFFAFVAFVVVIMLWPYTTKKSETKDGITITEFRRHYPIDIEDGGLGQYLDTEICIDAAYFCVRAKDVFFSYPTNNPSSPWIELCDPTSHVQLFFNRVTGQELKCSNCDSEALRCPKPPQTGTWFNNGNQSSELVGYVKENRSTVRTYTYGNVGVLMHEFPGLEKVAYGNGSIISEWFYGDKSSIMWIQCDDKNCGAYHVSFKTGQSRYEPTPCQRNDLLTLVLVGDRPEIRIDSEAKGDEICLNAQGMPAYPLGPEPIRLDPRRVDPPLVETPQSEIEPVEPKIQIETVQPKPPPKTDDEEQPEFGD